MNRIIGVCLLMPFAALCQPKSYTTQSGKAIKNFEHAVRFVEERQFDKAIPDLQDAIKADDNFMEAHMLLGDLFADKDETQKAIDEYKKAILINPKIYPGNFFTLGKYEMELEKYGEAKEYFTQFVAILQANPEKKAEAERDIKSCDFAMDAMKHAVSFNPQNIGDNINTQYDEYFPSFTVDEKQFLFTRNIPSLEYPGHTQEDFFISLNENGKLSVARPVGQPVNTPLNEGAPCFSADGKLIFFAGCDREGGNGSCDIYYSRKRGNTWAKPINLGPPVNTGAWESQPSFSSDGKTLYFVRSSGARANYEDEDIYMAQITDKGWSTPVKLSDKINTDGKEETPFIHPDNQTLYFVSDGHPGMGGSDIFMSRRQPDGSWGEPVNLGYPINTSKNETGLMVDPKGVKAYFSSNRAGGKGGLDIYSFDLDEKLKPIPVTYVHGVVTDAASKQPIETKFEIIDLANGQTVVETWSDKTSGDFLLTLPAGKDYAFNASKAGYLFYSEHFSLKNAADASHPLELNIALSPIKEGGNITLHNVFFDTNSSELKPESKTELDKLVSFMKQNATVKIEISGHTDNVGDDKSNQVLSENRAKSVTVYIAKNGIDASRLVAKGYGKTKPVADNASEEGRAKNRRTEVTIVAVK